MRHLQESDFSHTEKLYFPDSQLTKGDILEYYRKISDHMIPYLQERPVTLQRFPEGIKEQGFYQKQVPDYFPSWIERVTVEKRGDHQEQQLVQINNVETLLYLVNQGCLVFHPWLSRVDRLDEPDRAVLDLDPSAGDLEGVRQAVCSVYETLSPHFPVYVTTTGSSGYHLVLPLKRGKNFDEVRDDMKTVARLLEERFPKLLTTQQRKEKREGKVYLDIARNAYAQTSVSIYSVRAIQGAPVAAPLSSPEIEPSLVEPRHYTVRNIFRRLAQAGDPWKELWNDQHRRRLGSLIDALD